MSDLTTPTTDAGTLLAILSKSPAAEAQATAEAMLIAATASLIERHGAGETLAALGRLADRVRAAAPAPQPAPTLPADASSAILPADQLACAMVDQLRALDRFEAHERARAVVAGSAAFLHEAFGRSYATALLEGTLQAAAEFGDTIRGGRDSLDTVH